MKTIGWVKLHRSFLEWEHYSNKNVKIVFLHLLLTAAYKDTTIHGIEFKKGQILISERNLASELSMSRNVVRNVISKLIQSGELSTSKRVNKKTGYIYSITNFDKYQSGSIETTEYQDVLQKSPKPLEQPVNQPVKEPVNQPQKHPVKEPVNQPQKHPVKEQETTGKSEYYKDTSEQKHPVSQPQNHPVNQPVKEPVNQPQKHPVKEPLYNKNNKNINNTKNSNSSSHIVAASDLKSEAKQIIEEITKTLTVHSYAGEKKKRKVAAKEKKRGTLIAKAERKPITPENRYHNAAIAFWKLLKPIHGENYMFKNAELEKWEKDLRILENSRGYKLEKVFEVLEWAIKEDDNSVMYIQSPSFFLREKSKNIALLLKKREYWQKDIDKRNGVVRSISAPKNVIRAPED